MKTAGGALLFLISLDMVFARHSGGTGTTTEEEAEAQTRADISVVCRLATPPDGRTGCDQRDDPADQRRAERPVEARRGGRGALLPITGADLYLALLVAIAIQRLLGVTGLAVVSRIVGVLLAALSVQFIFDGIKASGLLGGH